MRKVSIKAIELLLGDYDKMMQYIDHNDEMYKIYEHYVAMQIKKIAGVEPKKKRNKMKKTEKIRVDAVSLVFVNAYLENYGIKEIISDFKEIGYEIED